MALDTSCTEQGLEFVVPLDAYGTMTGHCLDQHEPVLVRQMHDHIGHLSMFIDLHAKSFQIARFDMSPLLAGVTQVHDNAAGSESGAEVLDDLLDKSILPASRQRHLLSTRQLDRDKRRRGPTSREEEQPDSDWRGY